RSGLLVLVLILRSKTNLFGLVLFPPRNPAGLAAVAERGLDPLDLLEGFGEAGNHVTELGVARVGRIGVGILSAVFGRLLAAFRGVLGAYRHLAIGFGIVLFAGVLRGRPLVKR